MNSFLGIDYGTKKTGFAYSIGSFVFAWKTIPTVQIFDAIPKMIAEKNIIKIVIGMPYNIDGSISEHAKRVHIFAKKLAKNTDREIVFHDERLTSSEARIAFDEYHFSGDIDSEAARLMLADYIENHG